MAELYFPNPVAAMPEPRFYVPQQNNADILQGAISSLTGVADNFRRKQRSVQAANSMADILEAEGLNAEANAYREAAANYDINFFSTPEQNEQFNRGILTDTVKLLTEKKERDIRLESQRIQNEYYQGLISNQKATAENRSEDRQLAIQEREDRLQESKRVNTARLIGQRMDDIRYEVNSLDDELGKIQKGIEAGTIDPNDIEVKRRVARIQITKKQLGEQYNSLGAQFKMYMSADESGNSTEVQVPKINPFYSGSNPISGITSTHDAKLEQTQQEIDLLNQNRGLGRIGNVSRPLGTNVTIEKSDGTTEQRTTTPVPVDSAVKGEGAKKDPNAPGVKKPFSSKNL